MISIGALTFVYYINPWLALLLLPVGLFYAYARLKGGYHTKKDILGGIVLGLILGAWVGSLIDELFLPEKMELLFALLFFIFPACASIARIKEWV
jgi:membrane-associated phospholipid phosphatase